MSTRFNILSFPIISFPDRSFPYRSFPGTLAAVVGQLVITSNSSTEIGSLVGVFSDIDINGLSELILTVANQAVGSLEIDADSELSSDGFLNIFANLDYSQVALLLLNPYLITESGLEIENNVNLLADILLEISNSLNITGFNYQLIIHGLNGVINSGEFTGNSNITINGYQIISAESDLGENSILSLGSKLIIFARVQTEMDVSMYINALLSISDSLEIYGVSNVIFIANVTGPIDHPVEREFYVFDISDNRRYDIFRPNTVFKVEGNRIYIIDSENRVFDIKSDRVYNIQK